MDKTVAGLLGAVAGLAAAGSAHAAPNAAPMLQPASYADLLAPVPDAVAALKADDAARAQNPAPEIELAQYYHHHHHHHHYDRGYWARRRYYHHHHHHHRHVVIGIPGVGGVVVR